MGSDICFIITECNFREDILKDIKSILKKNGYAAWVAEEVSSFNIDLLEHRILKPMQQADFVVVILDPRGPEKKDANFNVAFEFGYTRGIPKDVILLFNDKLDNLPTDISRDYAISLLDDEWKNKLEESVKRQKEEKVKKFPPIPPDLVKKLELGIKDNQFDIFADLLDKLSVSFRILDNPEVVSMILRIFKEPKFDIYDGKPILNLLKALNTILDYDRSEKSLALKKEILVNLIQILKNSHKPFILRETLSLLIKINHDDAVIAIKQFIVGSEGYILKEICEGFNWNFNINSDLEFCNKLLGEILLIKSDPTYSTQEGRLIYINRIWDYLVSAIKDKHSQK
ncbi:hypothetical protein HYY71_05950 [Candidatus Woesearchaeota archaeon]|nr:hypothetical protein [Candidatus Woesearchaeota archaeon]